MKKPIGLILISILIIILIAGAVYFVVAGKGILPQPGTSQPPLTGGNSGICTMEAKLCPDGSYVGRVAPTCEFAACFAPTATSTATSSRTILETRLNQGASGLGLTITPREVIEDSRCPVNVVCIQAGTVRISATLEGGGKQTSQEFSLNVPVTTKTETIILTTVTPATYAGRPITPNEYRFTFTVTKR